MKDIKTSHHKLNAAPKEPRYYRDTTESFKIKENDLISI